MNNMRHFVYLHGFSSTPRGTKGRYFAERFRERGITVHQPDLNGDFEHLTITSQMKIAAGVIEELEGDITLLGSSMGGYLAALLAEQIPQIKKLVLIAPAFHFPARYSENLLPAELRKWQETGYLELYHYGYREKRRLHYGIIPDALEWEKKPISRNIPALIFHGLHDESAPYQLSIDYLKQNRQAELMLMSTDHQMHDKMERMWQYMELFLELSANNRP